MSADRLRAERGKANPTLPHRASANYSGSMATGTRPLIPRAGRRSKDALLADVRPTGPAERLLGRQLGENKSAVASLRRAGSAPLLRVALDREERPYCVPNDDR